MAQRCRSTYCTDVITRAAAEIVKRGGSPGVAAMCLGFGEGTFYNWIKAGRQELAARGLDGEALDESMFPENDNKSRYIRFAIAMSRANAECEAYLIRRVVELAEERGDWRGFMALLERRYPETWGSSKRREEVINVSSDDVGKAMMTLYAKGGGGASPPPINK